MKKIVNTIFIVMLALGLLGIILGISIGLYRNDVLARLQDAEALDLDPNEQALLEQYQNGGPDAAVSQNERHTLMELLLWGNLHTKFLVVGTVLTIISVFAFLISMRKSLERPNKYFNR